MEKSGKWDQDLAQAKNKIVENLQKFQNHEDAKVKQKQYYHALIDSLTSKECVIITDFKENLKIGGSPVETGYEYYNKRQVSLLSFACTYKENGETKTKYFDFFSYCLSHNLFFAKTCFKGLLGNDFFANFSKIHIWADGGRHFRSSEFAHFALYEIPDLFHLKHI